MQSTTGTKRFGICFLAFTVAWTTTPAWAWQFRDLDVPEASTVTTTESSESLQETAEQFVAPIISARAPIVNARDKKAETKPKSKPRAETTKKPRTLDAKVIETNKTTAPKQSPVDEPQPVAVEPQPAPVISNNHAQVKLDPIPEPIPEATPAAVEEIKETPPKVTTTTNPMDAFGGGDHAEATATHRIAAAKFNGVAAGETLVSELKSLWGEPSTTTGDGDEAKTLIYQVSKFRQVEVTTTGEMVTGILVHLTKPLRAATVATELGLEDITPVPVPDEFGNVLGQAYPERGLMLAFTEDVTTLRVSAILLEPISGEMFRMRAQHDFDHHYDDSLADLDEAIRLNPQDAESYWLRAQLLDGTGHSKEGLVAAQQAVKLKPTQPLYRLTRARLYAKTDRYDSAITEVRSVIRELELPNEIASRAENLLGDLLTIGPKADYQQALKHHLKAIDYGIKEVENDQFLVRRMAKHVLVSAHMAVARDIAMGNFQRQKEVVPKWLVRATDLAEEFVNDDQGDEVLKMQIFRETLACFAELHDASFDATSASEEALDLGRTIIAEADDLAYKVQIERLLAETMLHAAKIERSRGEYDNAMKYANNAMSLIEDSRDNWIDSSHDKYLKAELCFVLGSIKAIKDDDHYEAIEWYGKSRSLFDESEFISSLYTDRGFGEMQVSMGLSYWQTGDRDTAMEITELGGKLMKQAVESGSLQVAAMTVPYGNLATMHAKMGETDRSQEYAKLVARVEKMVNSKTIRQ